MLVAVRKVFAGSCTECVPLSHRSRSGAPYMMEHSFTRTEAKVISG